MRRPPAPPSPAAILIAILAVLTLGSAHGCSADASKRAPTGGSVIITSSADADQMIPPLYGSVTDRLAMELLFDPLIELGAGLRVLDDSGYAPRLARRWEWSADSLAIVFELDPRARWHDGQPVVARDAVVSFESLRAKWSASTLKGSLRDIDSVTAADERTVVVHFARRYSEQLYSASLLRPIPAHIIDALPDGDASTSDFARNPVGSGQYRLVRRVPKVEYELAAVEDHYRGRPGPDRILHIFTEDPTAAVAKLWSEEADVWEILPADLVGEAERYPHLRLVKSRAFDYSFAAFNFRDRADTSRPHPILGDRAMRRALTMSIDREGLVRALLDTLGLPVLGPFVRAQYVADTSLRQIPFDTATANRLLDSLGWSARGRDGVRQRGNKSLVLSTIVPAPSRNRNRAAVLMQEQFRHVGVALDLMVLEPRAFGAAMEAGRFDISLAAWGTTPSAGGLVGTWGSKGAQGWGGQNYGRYSNPAFDEGIAAGLSLGDPTRARRSFATALQVIVDDAPAIWLYEPVAVNAVHRRFITPEWRSDAWWRTIPEWRVDPAARLPRDTRSTRP